MSERYYEKVEEKTSQNYRDGRDFEYRVMRFLRKRGWHAMRRFGSHDEVIDGIGNVSTDVTAFRNGIYLIISCKYSRRHATTYLNDAKRGNLAKYAERFGGTCIPVFAGVNEKRRMYFIDLRTHADMTQDLYFRMTPPSKDPDKEDVQQLIDEAWALIDFCNQVINGNDDLKLKVRFANTKAAMIGHLTRLLYKAGATSAVDDITSIIERESAALQDAEDEEEEEVEEEDAESE